MESLCGRPFNTEMLFTATLNFKQCTVFTNIPTAHKRLLVHKPKAFACDGALTTLG